MTITWTIDDNKNWKSQTVTYSGVTIDLQNSSASVTPTSIVAGNMVTANTGIFNSGGGLRIAVFLNTS